MSSLANSHPDPAHGSNAAYVKDLLQSRLIARLAVHNADGTIHLTAVWFLYEAGRVLIPTFSRSRKLRNLSHDPRVTIIIDRAEGGFDVQGVMIRGHASVITGAEAASINRRIHGKYLLETALAEPIVMTSLKDDVTIDIRPDSISSWDHTQRAIARFIRDRALYYQVS
jgi:nitroimidazol reductase NimA-like FMN-containing flavoprotein (pyridoxamine 5'-phosphate oxidase superfamily)